MSKQHTLGSAVSKQHTLESAVSKQHTLGSAVSKQHTLGSAVPKKHTLGGAVSKQHTLGTLATRTKAHTGHGGYSIPPLRGAGGCWLNPKSFIFGRGGWVQGYGVRCSSAPSKPLWFSMVRG